MKYGDEVRGAIERRGMDEYSFCTKLYEFKSDMETLLR